MKCEDLPPRQQGDVVDPHELVKRTTYSCWRTDGAAEEEELLQYLIACVGRHIENPVIQGVIELEDPQTDFLPPRNMTLANAVDDKLDLNSPTEVRWWIKHQHTTVERLLVHMIAESHHHAGHLDIVREQLDGFISLRPSAPNTPDVTPGQWEEQRLRMEKLADGV